MLNLNHELLRNDLSLKEAEQLQIKYCSILEKQQKNKFTFNSLKDIKRIVGVDVSYHRRKNEEIGVSCATLWNLIDTKLENYEIFKGKVKFPYHSGFLGFRECRLLAKTIEKLPIKPDLIMCDGHGIAHPRRFGEAVHLGFALDIPTIGIAKNPFIGYCDWKRLKRKKGNKKPILAFKPNSIKNSKPEVLGYAICLNNKMKPVFISVGYKTTIALALEIALKTSLNHRQPEPLYLADYYSRQKIQEDKNF